MLSEEREILEYIKEAFRLRSENLYKQAVEMLYKALTLDNDNIEIFYQLGELYVLMHNPVKALGYLEKVLSKQPQHIECLKLVSRIHMENNEYNDALIFALKAFELEKKSENLMPLIKIYGELKMFDKLEEFSEYKNMTYEIAEILYKNGKIDEAENKLKTCEQTEAVKILLGKIYFDKNNLKKSREIFSSFGKNSENPEILNYQGLFHLEDMDFTNAIKCFSKATHINKNNPVYFYNLANAYFFNGWMEEAQTAYSKAIYLAPDNMDYRYSLAYLYYEINNFDKCKKEVETILAAEKKHYRAKVLKALLLNRENNFMEAKNILEENLQINNNDNFTLVSLSKTYVGLDMFKKAEEILLTLTENHPENFDYISDLSDIYIKEKDFDKALEPALKLIKQNPNYLYGYVLAAKASYLSGNLQNAKEYAQEAISLDMNCSDGYYYLALVRFEEKDYDEAIECMKRAIIYNPANPEYYAQMSKIYKEKNDIKTALDYISEAESIAHSAEYQDIYKELAALNRKL